MCLLHLVNLKSLEDVLDTCEYLSRCGNANDTYSMPDPNITDISISVFTSGSAYGREVLNDEVILKNQDVMKLPDPIDLEKWVRTTSFNIATRQHDCIFKDLGAPESLVNCL